MPTLERLLSKGRHQRLSSVELAEARRLVARATPQLRMEVLRDVLDGIERCGPIVTEEAVRIPRLWQIIEIATIRKATPAEMAEALTLAPVGLCWGEVNVSVRERVERILHTAPEELRRRIWPSTAEAVHALALGQHPGDNYGQHHGSSGDGLPSLKS